MQFPPLCAPTPAGLYPWPGAFVPAGQEAGFLPASASLPGPQASPEVVPPFPFTALPVTTPVFVTMFPMSPMPYYSLLEGRDFVCSVHHSIHITSGHRTCSTNPWQTAAKARAGEGLHSADRTLLGALGGDFGSTAQSHEQGCLLPGSGPPKRTQPRRTRSRGSHGPREPPFRLPSLHSSVLGVAQRGAQSLQTQWGERVRGYSMSHVGPRERSLLANTPSTTHLMACEQTQMPSLWHSRLFQPPSTSLSSLQGCSSPPPVHPRSGQASRMACWPPCPCLCWGLLPGHSSPGALPPPAGSPPSGWPSLGSHLPCLA